MVRAKIRNLITRHGFTFRLALLLLLVGFGFRASRPWLNASIGLLVAACVSLGISFVTMYPRRYYVAMLRDGERITWRNLRRKYIPLFGLYAFLIWTCARGFLSAEASVGLAERPFWPDFLLGLTIGLALEAIVLYVALQSLTGLQKFWESRGYSR